MRERQQAFRDLERSFHDVERPQQQPRLDLAALDLDRFPTAAPVHHHPAVSLFQNPANLPPVTTMLSTRPDHRNQVRAVNPCRMPRCCNALKVLYCRVTHLVGRNLWLT